MYSFEIQTPKYKYGNEVLEVYYVFIRISFILHTFYKINLIVIIRFGNMTIVGILAIRLFFFDSLYFSSYTWITIISYVYLIVCIT